VSDPSLPLLLGLLALCLLLSAFFSGTETALMSFNRYQLRTMANAGHRGAILAEKLLARPDRLIGLILLGNNLANNLAATLVTVIVLRVWGDEWVAVGAGLLTLVMLIFCEVGPKTYGALHPRCMRSAGSRTARCGSSVSRWTGTRSRPRCRARSCAPSSPKRA
jgi:Mg2+/Co2+ transporter CorB